jgi:transcription factor SFP1
VTNHCLRYHKTHGHSTQQLHENGDGTFSIVNPETSTPYPGTLGMEKEKPFKCEVCGKRYKNLNGLKYVSLRGNHSRITSC